METCDHHRPGRPAYFRGRPASLWLDATTRRQPATIPHDLPFGPSGNGVSVTPP
jgi:hypothetical protein